MSMSRYVKFFPHVSNILPAEESDKAFKKAVTVRGSDTTRDVDLETFWPLELFTTFLKHVWKKKTSAEGKKNLILDGEKFRPDFGSS